MCLLARQAQHAHQVLGDSIRGCGDVAIGLVVEQLAKGDERAGRHRHRDVEVGDLDIFLLGDAAHLTPHFIGQGLCAGLRDSMNLSWKLAGVLSGDLPESVLDTYEVERAPHARAMITLAKFIGVAMTQGGRAGNTLRRIIAPRLGWIPGMRERLLDGETPRLARSALAIRPRGQRSTAGWLCPNALVADGTRYDDVTGGGFVLVTSATLPRPQQAVLSDRGTEVLRVEPGTELHQWLAKGHATAALVRPDLTVMQSGRDLTTLCAAAPTFHASVAATSR